MGTDTGNYWSTRRVSRRAWLRGAGVGAVGLAGAALIGCGSSSSNATATPGTGGAAAASGTAAAKATQAAAKVKTGGTLQLAQALDPSSLDPHTGVSGGDDYYWMTMFDQLVGHDDQNVLQPGLSLAESWEIPDSQTITLHLRKGVKFHDGTDFDSSSVKYSITRVQDPTVGSTARTSLLPIASVGTPDPATATFKLSAPNAALMANLGLRGGAVVSQAAVEKYGKQFSSNPVGTGPYVFQEWVSGSHVTVKKNATYWRKDAGGAALPYLDSVNMRIIPDPTAALAALTSGEIDLSGISPKDVKSVQANSSIQMAKREGSGIASLLTFNQSMPLGNNADFRRAICYAVDPNAANQAVYFGLDIVAKGGAWPPGTWVYQDVAGRPTYDVAKAKDFLAKSGVPSGTTIEAVTWGTLLPQEAQLYQQQLKQIGIDMKITVQDVGQATNAFFKNNQFPLYVTGWSLYPEPDYDASLIYDKAGSYNPAKMATDQVEQLIAQGRSEYDQAKRKAIYAQINDAILGDALFVPLLYGVSYVGAAKKVQGMDHLWTGEAKWKYDMLSLA
jgi:peptide/nickel transport system substrate-binding protein